MKTAVAKVVEDPKPEVSTLMQQLRVIEKQAPIIDVAPVEAPISASMPEGDGVLRGEVERLRCRVEALSAVAPDELDVLERQAIVLLQRKLGGDV